MVFAFPFTPMSILTPLTEHEPSIQTAARVISDGRFLFPPPADVFTAAKSPFGSGLQSLAEASPPATSPPAPPSTRVAGAARTRCSRPDPERAEPARPLPPGIAAARDLIGDLPRDRRHLCVRPEWPPPPLLLFAASPSEIWPWVAKPLSPASPLSRIGQAASHRPPTTARRRPELPQPSPWPPAAASSPCGRAGSVQAEPHPPPPPPPSAASRREHRLRLAGRTRPPPATPPPELPVGRTWLVLFSGWVSRASVPVAAATSRRLTTRAPAFLRRQKPLAAGAPAVRPPSANLAPPSSGKLSLKFPVHSLRFR
ncbi:vegetative cell wall protein gp1-like [Ananas comosus]|uniref:Vegetative cell wall protein gp1-like n=1 Tax=Ananas comosus TaxID=4615 RepID=A0A6P5EL69_ANACO|nr:vegetative cell wall protein gp1-like [Ananas comosus]